MKAAVIESPGIVTVKDIRAPEMGEYDALCEILYGATCSGTDLHLMHGRFPWPVDYPTVLGHESIGRIIKLGGKVRNLNLGDLVTRVGTVAAPESEYAVNWGGFAQFGIARDYRAMKEDGIDESHWSGFRVNQVIPPHFDPAASTMIITWRETLSYVKRMGILPGASVLVAGSGGNGLSMIAHAVNLGASSVAAIGSYQRQKEATALGAVDYFDYRVENLKEAISGKYPEGFDFIIDAVGKQGQMDLLLPLVKSGGKVGVYGIDDFHSYTFSLSSISNTFTFFCGGYDEEEAHDSVVDYMERGLLKADVWFNAKHPYLLENINEAYSELKDRKAVKALIKIKE